MALKTCKVAQQRPAELTDEILTQALNSMTYFVDNITLQFTKQ